MSSRAPNTDLLEVFREVRAASVGRHKHTCKLKTIHGSRKPPPSPSTAPMHREYFQTFLRRLTRSHPPHFELNIRPWSHAVRRLGAVNLKSWLKVSPSLDGRTWGWRLGVGGWNGSSWCRCRWPKSLLMCHFGVIPCQRYRCERRSRKLYLGLMGVVWITLTVGSFIHSFIVSPLEFPRTCGFINTMYCLRLLYVLLLFSYFSSYLSCVFFSSITSCLFLYLLINIMKKNFSFFKICYFSFVFQPLFQTYSSFIVTLGKIFHLS